MRSSCLIPLLFTLVCSSAIPQALQPVEKRDTCASLDVKVVVDILKILKASPFCSSFLSIKTSTETVTATTVGAPVVQTVTTTTPVVISATTTVSSTETDVNTVTTTTGNPATVTNTIESPILTTVISTITTTTTATVDTYTNVGVAKRDNQPRDLKIPSQLLSFGRDLITTACECYATTPTATVTSIVTSTPSSVVTTTAPSTTTLDVATSTEVTTTTSQTTVAVSNTVIVTLTTTSPTTTVTTTTTTSVQDVTATATISVSYTEAFSGTGCVYNEYTDFFVLDDSSFEAAVQDCANQCDQSSSCESFFIYYSPPSGRFAAEYDCTIDSNPYNGGYTQCGVYFAAQAVAYNKN